MSVRKGIVLAGGSGTRLWPITLGVSKHLLPVYDKPMIYYPLSVLMLAGIRDIAIITTPEDQDQFVRLLGDGAQWGISLTYIVQPKPEGIAQAYVLTEDFLAGSPSALILGDNIFFGHGLPELLREADRQASGATVFGYQVADPERYGVVEFGPNGDAYRIIEKPKSPASNLAVTGLFFFDESASEFAKQMQPPSRRELEIVDLLQFYLQQGNLFVERLGRGFAWFDTGSHSSLLDAGNFVRTLTERQGLQVGSPEEVAWQQGFLSGTELQEQANRFLKSGYGRYLMQRLEKSR